MATFLSRARVFSSSTSHRLSPLSSLFLSSLPAPSAAALPALRRAFSSANSYHGTTILSVRTPNGVVVIGDGQVTLGDCVVKPTARKVRVLGLHSSAPTASPVLCGFAGSTADCLTLLDLLEKKIDEYPGQLLRASVELAKLWRTDKILRNLQASIIAVDKEISLTISGNGDVLSEPIDGIIGIGSGGFYALSAARALKRANFPLRLPEALEGPPDEAALVAGNNFPQISAREIALRSMAIARDLCIYTNGNFAVEEIVGSELLVGEKKTNKEKGDKVFLRKLEE